jgi:hypothetical protein
VCACRFKERLPENWARHKINETDSHTSQSFAMKKVVKKYKRYRRNF